MNNETCVECSGPLPPAYALTTCPKCSEVLARIRSYAEANGAAESGRPLVRRGDVLLTLGHEIAIAGKRLRDLEAFEVRVTEAAQSPSAWLALRAELNGSGK